MSKRYIAIAIICCLVLALCVGGAVAYMFKLSNESENGFKGPNVSCKLLESFDGEKKSSVTVKNTSEIEVYVRVRLVTYWVDESGNIVTSQSSPELGIVYDANWVKGENNTYYYKSAVAPGSTSSNLLAQPYAVSTDGNKKQVVEVFAEAIQANPEKAAEESWGVQVSGGQITVN